MLFFFWLTNTEEQQRMALRSACKAMAGSLCPLLVGLPRAATSASRGGCHVFRGEVGTCWNPWNSIRKYLETWGNWGWNMIFLWMIAISWRFSAVYSGNGPLHCFPH